MNDLCLTASTPWRALSSRLVRLGIVGVLFVVLTGCEQLMWELLREGPPPNERPKPDKVPPDNRGGRDGYLSRYGTFRLVPANLPGFADLPSTLCTSCTGYVDVSWNCGPDQYPGAFNARYRVLVFYPPRPKGSATAPPAEAAYEVREYSNCRVPTEPSALLSEIMRRGGVGETVAVLHRRHGRIDTYLRRVDSYQETRHSPPGVLRLERGAVFAAHGRTYNLLVFRLLERDAQNAFTLARERVSLDQALTVLLDEVQFEPGEAGLCVDLPKLYKQRTLSDCLRADPVLHDVLAR